MSLVRCAVNLAVPLKTISALTLCWLCQSCAQPSPAVSKSPQEDPTRFVRVEARYGDANPAGQTRFNHPLELSEREWTRILENVWVRHEPGVMAFVSPQEPPVPAFTPDEIAFLSKSLGKVFSRAHPDERVVFGLSRARSEDITEVTTGGWYVEGERLHLMLANYRYAVTMSSVRKRLWDDPLQSMGDRYYTFAAGDHQSVTFVGGGPLGDLRGTSIPQLALDYKGLLKAISAAKPVPKSDASQPAVSPERGHGSDAAQKLRELKQLRDEGVVTEEEYRTKKQQLLDRY
jgi:putative oligomerization/nucleic acid binding protein